MPTKIDELMEVYNILEQNKDMNFVQRINHPEAFPKLYDNPGGFFGESSTHSMAAEVDEKGEWFVYPTVVPKGDGSLRRMTNPEAAAHAKSTGEQISFGGDAEKAIWFSQQYKQVWKNK